MRGTRWARLGLWLLCTAVLFLPLFDAPALATGAYVQDVRPDSARVCKVTAEPADLELLVRERGGAEVARSSSRGVRRHEFAIASLRPATRYEWSVAEAGGALETGAFRTPPRGAEGDADPVRFAVVGDSGGLPWWIWLQNSALVRPLAAGGLLPTASAVTAIGDRIAKAEPDFVLHVGDVVYPRGQQQHYAAGFFRPFAPALRQAPFYVALGNHDVLDDDGRQALANFALPRGGLTGDERCYSFAYGPVRVIALDLGLETPGQPLPADHPAFQFLREELPRCSEPWVVVTSHYPIFSASRQKDRADLREHLLPLLEEFGVDLYLCGHDHTYQRFGEPGEGLVQVVSGGGGKSLYEVQVDRRVRIAVGVYHWCRAEVRGRELEFRAISVDGAVVDTFRLHLGAAKGVAERLRARNPARWARIEPLLR